MAGMDPKILAAVFASIAALAVGTGGGSVDNFQKMNPQEMIGEIIGSSSGLLDDVSKRPEPDNSVKVSIEINSDEARIHLRDAEMTVKDFTKLESSSRSISSDEPLTFLGFTGEVAVEEDNETLVKGTSNGFRSSGVNFTEKLDLEFMTDTTTLNAEDVDKTAIDFSNIDVKMVSKTDDTVIQKGNSSLKINSFSGDIAIYPQNMSIVLDGKVAKFEAGGTVFTG